MEKTIYHLVAALFFGFIISNFSGNAQMRNWDAEGFSETSKWAKETAYEVIDSIIWRGDESVLDIGTGDGKICSVIASKTSGEVLGIDPSQEMITYAREHFTKERYPNLSFEVNAANSYQSNNRFDIITSFTVLHLVPNQKDAIKNLAGDLKQGGRLFVKFPIDHGFEQALEKTLQLPQWRILFKDFHNGWYFETKQRYQQFLEEANLTVVRIEEGILDECYDSKEEMIAAISYWLPHVQKLSSEQQKIFLNDLITLFLNEVPEDSAGKFHHYEPFLYVEAIKA